MFFRENTSVDDILKDLEGAICSRRALNNDLEKLSEEAKIHYKKAEAFQERKHYQKALHEYSKVKMHKKFHCTSLLW